MLRRFLLSLLSSWIVNPLGILVAQWFGVANASVVILVLLATGACVPFQLLLNECLAAAVNRGSVSPTRMQLVSILGVQGLASIGTLWALTGQDFSIAEAALISLLLCLNTYASYRATLIYFGLALRSRLTDRSAILIGSSPGLTSLACYIAFSITRRLDWPLAGGFVLFAALAPTLIQWIYVRWLAKLDIHADESPHRLDAPPVDTLKLSLALVALAALAALSTGLRDAIASLSANHVALLLVALNSLLSLVNTATRAKFLVRGGSSIQGALGGVVGAALLAFGIASLLHWRPGTIFALIAVQASIAWVIEAARRIPPARQRPEVV
jgi:hypothetical protein